MVRVTLVFVRHWGTHFEVEAGPHAAVAAHLRDFTPCRKFNDRSTQRRGRKLKRGVDGVRPSPKFDRIRIHLKERKASAGKQ